MRLKAVAPIALGIVFAFGEPAFAKKAAPNAKPAQAASAPPQGLACTLSAVPPVVEAGTDVTITLRVVGTVGAERTSINNRDLKSAVGGSSRFKVDKASTFVGRVQKGKVTSTCSVDVTVGKPLDPADAKPAMIEPPT